MLENKSAYAYAGKILRINLSNGEISTESTLKYAREWLGASGIAIKILYDELRSWTTPYEPTNKLIFGAGPLIGTTAPGANKMNVSTLGPMTGGWASGCSDSYVGGQLKYAGYDSIVIEGKAHMPVYLWIHDDYVEIRGASHIWGKTTWETQETIRKELADNTLHTLSIGPAGERLVRGACIIQGRGRAFGRCGAGAVMGAKNLKAIVVKGTGGVRIARPKLFMNSVARIRQRVNQAQGVERMRKYGTLRGLAKKQEVCGINFKNFQECVIPDKMVKAIDPCKTIDKYEVARQSFPGCVIGCSRHLYITDGPFVGLKTESCQMEAMLTLQTRLGIWEPTFMMKANAYCNQLGLDIDAAAGPIGWAMECYQRGIITKKDTNGLELNWGDSDVVLELIRKISYREGFGNILAEGCARAADIVNRNSGYYAMHIKGQDLYELCRGALGWCLGVTTSTRGGGHTTGAPAFETVAVLDPKKIVKAYGCEGADNPLQYEGKAKLVVFIEALHRVNNSLGICHLNTIWTDPDFMNLAEIAELYSTATGWETSVEDLKKISEKQLNLEKVFNLRHTSFDRKDDLPTSRDLEEPIPAGNLAGWKIDKTKYNKMLDEYYELHGWDKETSYPKRNTLEDLGLEYVINELEKIGKLR